MSKIKTSNVKATAEAVALLVMGIAGIVETSTKLAVFRESVMNAVACLRELVEGKNAVDRSVQMHIAGKEIRATIKVKFPKLAPQRVSEVLALYGLAARASSPKGVKVDPLHIAQVVTLLDKLSEGRPDGYFSALNNRASSSAREQEKARSTKK